MPNAVIVVDMLRGFFEEAYPLYVGEKACGIIANIQRLLERELAQGSKVFFIGDQHDPDDLEFKIYPPHCVAGSIESEIIPELDVYPGEVIPKKRYSGFFNTKLEEKLQQLKPDKLIICGVATNICVLYTVADARNRDYDVDVLTDCVASFNEDAHNFALEHMAKVLGARLTTSEDTPR